MTMIDPSIDYLAEKVGSKYGLVIMAAKRARQLVDHAPALVESKSISPFPSLWKKLPRACNGGTQVEHQEIKGVHCVRGQKDCNRCDRWNCLL